VGIGSPDESSCLSSSDCVLCMSPFFTHYQRAVSYNPSHSIALILAFTIPRVPSFALNNSIPLANATGAFKSSIPASFSRAPANFSFPAYAALQVNTQGNFLPLTFKHLRAQVYDLETNERVATGDLGHMTVPAKSFPNIYLPLNFTYVATNDTDQTCEFPGCLSIIWLICRTHSIREKLVQCVQKFGSLRRWHTSG